MYKQEHGKAAFSKVKVILRLEEQAARIVVQLMPTILVTSVGTVHIRWLH